MERIHFTERNGSRIMVLDLADSKSIEENIAGFEQAEKLIIAELPKSVRLLTNVSNAHYSPEAVDRMKQFSKTVTPHMLASAAVGISGIKRIVLYSLMRLTGRNIKMFDSADEALDWLAAQ